MSMNSYIREAFGGLDPNRDQDAALKFALGLLMAAGEAERLLPVLAHPARGIGGDPGWEIERRNPSPPVASAYAAWPAWATYRAYVDPEGFRLEHPESFYDERTFAKYVWVALAVYGRHRPTEMHVVARLLDLLPKRTVEVKSEVA